MKQIRKRLTYANVMSSIAVFLVLGGAAFAAVQLPKNSVGSKQLKKNAVTAAKIKKDAVTSAKVKNGAITNSKLADGSITTGKLANDSVTGEKVVESTLGTVPSAQTASSFAGTTQQIVKYRAVAGAGPTTLFSAGGLTITAACNGVGPKFGVFTATTDTNDSSIWVSGFNFQSDLNFDVGDNQNVAVTEGNDAYSIVYQRGLEGSIVTADIGIRQKNDTPGNSDCQAVGRFLIG